MNRLTGALVAALSLASAGCGVRSVTTDINRSVTRSPTCDEAIEVYKTRSEVPYDYYELAFVTAKGNSLYTTDGQLLNVIRKRAAEVGANAVIANPVQQSTSTVKVIGEAIGAKSATSQATALAIYMPADSSRVTVKCGTK
ncbi:MAG TPA: hypothetical protein VIF83_05435 [Gemmatimonadaceae bacterium]|jgi:hypothetical protein